MRSPSGRPIRRAIFGTVLTAFGVLVSSCTLNWDPLLPADGGSACGTLGLACCPTDAAPSECVTGLACNAGTCACGAGTMNCGGSCVDTTSSSMNCGACGTMCGMNEVCNASVCMMRCSMGQMMCGTTCIDTVHDSANCGACGLACGTGQTCRNSTCQ